MVRTGIVLSVALAVLSLGGVAVEQTDTATGSHRPLHDADDAVESASELQSDRIAQDWTQSLPVHVVVGLLAGAVVTGTLAARWSNVRPHLDRLPGVGRSRTSSNDETHQLHGARSRRTARQGRTTRSRLGQREDANVRTSRGLASTGATPQTWPVPDERRICDLLESADGRLKQTAIVDATGWSKSKVSQRLSELAADDVVVKIRVGRENLVCLPEEVPEMYESPFDE